MRKKNYYWIIMLKVFGGIALAIVVLAVVLLMYAYINNIGMADEEEQYLEAPGEMVQVGDYKIHVLQEGDAESDKTLVFLHANKTVDDSIALQPLFDKLSEYNLIYIDRSGVGFSDDADTSKDIDSMLEETRTALKAVDDSNSYVLVASKSAGIEALYWAYKYPDEVETIIGLEMYFPDQYTDLDDDTYCGIGNRVLLLLSKVGAQRYASNVYPENTSSLYTDRQMKVRDALISNRLYTKGMYNEDANVVKNGKEVAKYGWPEDLKMYLIYANPFMDPYLHEDEDVLSIYEEVAEQGEEYDCEASYNDYYRTYFADYANVTIEEVSAPERLITYNPDEIAEMIKDYLNTTY